ncbi:HK97 family phage prohead protease [Streptomyces hygroscopicus]|uniref:HK97 family phage prohead protease n=1 Tax=Streptomyces hygroscopicus TaxID=1912 RepID=UPI000767606E|nr:HK97 family phage prohead protease [Streptomyces hygroscopicus]
MSSATERRFTRGLVEVRAAGETRTIGGYAAKFNTLSRNLGGFVERIDPGFFAKSEGDGWPEAMARYNHDDNMLLGTTGGGTLRLVVDGTGLDYSVDVPQSRDDVYELVQRGDVRRSSFAFYTFADDWGMTEQGFPVRTLLSGQLVDVAPVNTPAYLDTSTGLRSLAEKAGAELEEVRAAAADGDLKKFLAKPKESVVIDIKGEPAEAAHMLRGAILKAKTSAQSGQGDPHPLVAVRQRRAALYQRRTF